MPRDGYVYVFNTPGYRDEAERSYRSLRQHMPQVEVAFVTHPQLFDSSRSDVIWVPFETKYDSPIVKIEAFGVPFDRCIFLDSDTRILRDCGKMFSLLDRFDIAVAHEPTRGWDYQSAAPQPFCEHNTGVLAFRKNDATARFFQAWYATYLRMRDELGLLNDQPAFRETLWSSQDVSHATIPSEFHLITGKPSSIAWDPHILHGREDLRRVGDELKSTTGPRMYSPDLGVVTAINGRRAALSTLIEMMRRLLPKIATRPRSNAAAAPGDWQQRAIREQVKKKRN